jgi:hypothetical protein
MRLKIACYVEIEVPENATNDQIYNTAHDVILENRSTYEFVIEEVDGNQDHELVDEVVP